MPNDDKLMELIKTYDDNGDGVMTKEEMKEFILNTLTVGWVPKNNKKKEWAVILDVANEMNEIQVSYI